MRTRANITLDNDVYDFASAYASAKGLSLGSAVSELLRQVEQMPAVRTEPTRLKMNEHGFLVIAGTGNGVTPEMVKKLSEDEIG